MHDCMPRNYYYQAVPRSQINWNGDTWKAFLEIRTNTDLDTYCCYADEGIGVILKRENRIDLYEKCLNFLNTRVELDLANFKDDIWSH